MQKSMVQALGAQKWITLTQHSSTEICLKHLKSLGYRVIASDLGSDSKPIGEVKWPIGKNGDHNNNAVGRIAIVMGSEKDGISETVRCQADSLFYLPMKGFAQSFNLGVASAITCAHLDAIGTLNPNICSKIKQRILLTWLVRSAEGSMPLLRKAGLDVGYQKKPPYAVICGVSARP